MAKRLKVKGIGWGATADSLRGLFARYGEVEEVKVATDWETGRSRGFGWVTYPDNDQADQAIEALQGQPFDGKGEMKIEVVEETAPVKPLSAAPLAESLADEDVAGAAKALRIEGIGYSTGERELRELLGRFGTVTSIEIPEDWETGRPRGFALVVFAKAGDADKARTVLDGSAFKRKKLKITEAEAPKKKVARGAIGKGGKGGGGGGNTPFG